MNIRSMMLHSVSKQMLAAIDIDRLARHRFGTHEEQHRLRDLTGSGQRIERDSARQLAGDTAAGASQVAVVGLRAKAASIPSACVLWAKLVLSLAWQAVQTCWPTAFASGASGLLAGRAPVNPVIGPFSSGWSASDAPK